MSLAEILLVLGTFGICTGVWVTLKVIIEQGKENAAIACVCEPVPMTITEKELS